MAHLVVGVSTYRGAAIVRHDGGGGGGGGGVNSNRIEGLFLIPKPPLPWSLSLKPPSTLSLNSIGTASSSSSFRLNAKKKAGQVIQNTPNNKKEEVIEVEEEEDLPWIQEKALDLVEFTGSVSQPGPRVGQSSLPWLLAVPLGYTGITFVITFVRTVKKFSSPRTQKAKIGQQKCYFMQIHR